MIGIKKDQRGIAHLALILVAIVVIAGVGFAGWRVMSNKDDDTKAASTEASASDKDAVAACNKAFDDKDLCKFTGNYALDKLPYKMVLTYTTGDGTTSSTFLYDGKGNSSMTGAQDGQETAMIFLNGDSYTKDNTDGQWFKFPKGNSSEPKAENPTSNVKFDTAVDKAAESKITYKKLGKEKCGDLTCFKYQTIDAARPNATDYFWFGTKDYRLQHFYSKDAAGTSDMVITYQKVNITAPSPTKEFSVGGDAAAAAQAQAAAGAYGQ